MHYTIYKITNKINGNFYIGKHKTKNLNDKYMGSGKLIQAAIKKHGIENFEKEILETFNTEEEMNEAEKRYVVLGEGSYNLCPGGQGGWGYVNTNNLGGTLGLKHTEEYKNNHSLITKRIYENRDEETKKDISKKIAAGLKAVNYDPRNFLGKKHTQEAIQKMSLSKEGHGLGEKNSQFGTIWISNGIEEKKIKASDQIPEGWTKQRLQSFKNDILKDIKKKEKEQQKNIALETKKQELHKLYEIYKVKGFAGVRQEDYKHSQPYLVMSFAKYFPDFIPQNGKKRKQKYSS
jgi:hypothetical protein